MRKVSVEAECSPLLMVSVNQNWSKLCFRKLAGNVSTEEEVVTCWLKQEPVMELTGLHVQLKLWRENEKLSHVRMHICVKCQKKFWTHCSFSLPDWLHGEIRVVRSLPVQRYYSGVSVINEDIGAALNGNHRRAGYHLNSHAVVTVNHTADNLNLQNNSSYRVKSQSLKSAKLQIY